MAKLGNVKVRTLRDVAYESISEAILTNELMPGETLTITRLAEKMGISPTPVREAVVRLSNEGILDYEANKRIKVSRITREDVSEIYEARRLLELHVSRKFFPAVKENSELKKRLEDLKQEALDLIETKKGALQYTIIDLKLHELFLEMIGNDLLKELLYIVGNKSLRIRTFVEATSGETQSSGESLEPGAREHLEIIEALLGCDEDRIAKAMEAHLIKSEERTLRSLEHYFDSV